MSSARPTTRDDLVPRAGSNSNSVITGPGIDPRYAALHAKVAQHTHQQGRTLHERWIISRWLSGLARWNREKRNGRKSCAKISLFGILVIFGFIGLVDLKLRG